MGDFNPGFQFDFGDGAAAAQPAWEFAGALRQAHEAGPVHGTSIDHKIAQRLQQRGGDAATTKQRPVKGADGRATAANGHHKQQPVGGRPGGKRSRGQREDSEDEEDEEDDEDAPLPGELDEEEEDVEDDDEDEEEEEEEDAGPATRPAPARGAPPAAGGRSGRAPAAAAQEAEAEGTSGEEEEENDEEGEEEEEGVGANGAAVEKNGPQQQRSQQAGARAGGKTGTFYSETPEGTKFTCSSFADLNLSRPLLKAVEALGYKTPTPIQAACIPLALAGRDICGSAVTGSGKTAAFALPCLERLMHRPRGLAATYILVLTPTRELAVQIHSMIEKLSQFTDVAVALIVGGLSLAVQAATLRKLPEIVVATPGRLLDHLRNSQSVGLEDLAVLVLDEADRLLEMGFREEVCEVVRCAPRRRQTLLFSATFNDQVRDLVSLSLKQPVRLAADAALQAPKQLAQEIIRLKGPAAAATKEAMCLALCARSFATTGRTIVFCSTKQRAHRLKILFGLAKLPPAAELHGNMSQTARLESLESFRRGDTAFLLATDVAARGLDIQGVQVVVNFDAPSKLETYLHRIGRTARAGAAGVAVTMIEDGDRHLLKDMSRGAAGAGGLRQRLVPAPAVTQWQARVEKMEADVAAILSEERQEADLRKAEMEANKAANMVEHEDEIMARPKRTWFLSGKQKKDLQRRSAAAAAGDGEEGDEDGDGEEQGGGGSKAAKAANKAERRAARKAEAAKEARDKEAGKRKTGAKDPQVEANRPAVRSIKTLARELQQQHGLTAIKAARLAAQQITGLKSGSKKKSANNKNKKQKTGDNGEGGDDGGRELFSGDGLNTARPGKLSVAPRADADDGGFKSIGRFGGKLKSQLSRQEKNTLKRGGKGKRAFKSKGRFKRR